MAEIDKGLPNTRNKEELPSQEEIQDVAVQEPVEEKKPIEVIEEEDGGVTLDRAWKTIRYALHEIDKGPRNPQAAYMLTRNKAYIQDETIAWMYALFLVSI